MQGPLTGQVVCPTINLWNEPTRTRKVGKLSHDAEVEVYHERRGPDGRLYYDVSGEDEQGQKQRGWVSEPFLVLAKGDAGINVG